MRRDIVYYGEPVLKVPAEEVRLDDPDLPNLIADLRDTLYWTTGIGIAAPQIGISKRAFAYDLERESPSRQCQIVINPVVLATSGKVLSPSEGCLSSPTYRVDVERFEEITISGLDANLQPFERKATGMEAIVIQHELDHLDGTCIADLLKDDEREEYLKRLENIVALRKDPERRETLRKVKEKLATFSEEPEGAVYTRSSGNSHLMVDKDGRQLRLFFLEPGRDRGRLEVSGIMSRVDIDAPMRLLGLYTQAMVLSLLWTPDPKHLYVLGFGGGRLPMVLSYYYPNLHVDSTEIDPAVVEVAKRYFGISTGERQRVYVEDGRAFLQRLDEDRKYDIILVDCFSGSGKHPIPLSTVEFYELCLQHLTHDGVVATNLVASDPLFKAKVDTFVTTFPYVWHFHQDVADVFFGSRVQPDWNTLRERAKTLFERHGFEFPFVELLADLQVVSPIGVGPALRDDRLVEAAATALRPDDPIFRKVGRNDPCPCGSGKKFKKCHGASAP